MEKNDRSTVGKGSGRASMAKGRKFFAGLHVAEHHNDGVTPYPILAISGNN